MFLFAFLAVAMATIQFIAPGPANATDLIDGDIIAPHPYAPTELFEVPRASTQAAGDPLNLLLYPAELRRYSLGRDVFEVWACPSGGTVPTTAERFVVDAETLISPYFAWLSDGRYDPDFIVGGTVPTGADCASWARTNTTGVANAVLFILAGEGGFATPGYSCSSGAYTCPTTYPDNAREGYVGISGGSWSTLAHEMGHMLSWAHSSAGSSDYDNAIDVMSGNFGKWSAGGATQWGTYPAPYATIGINRYGAGWFDPDDVIVWDGTSSTVTITPTVGARDQMLVIDAGASYYTFDLRVSQHLDPFPTAWTGVEVYRVDRCSRCWGVMSEITATPAVPFNYADSRAYSRPLPHVLTVGDSITVGPATVTLVERSAGGAALQIVATVPPSATRFRDVPESHVFYADVEWLAAAGITKGCNPPVNDRFCPDANVTRGQMAAFLVRALDLTDRLTDPFTDDDESIFQADIERLAAAGITKGCNPPVNDRFCPDANVTRGQMAAFLARALR